MHHRIVHDQGGITICYKLFENSEVIHEEPPREP